MKFEKNRMTFLELKTNTVGEKDYHTLSFLDNEANKESLNFTGSVTDFKNIKENDFIDLHCKVYREKENYYKIAGISCYKVEKNVNQ
jgi:hypothetical protein